MFQYEKVMALIETNRKQLERATDADYMDMLQEDFHNLKKRKQELGSKLGSAECTSVIWCILV